MIFAKKRDGNPPSWALCTDGFEEPDVICFDDKVALKIVSLWNNAEREAFDRQQNLEALERQQFFPDDSTTDR